MKRWLFFCAGLLLLGVVARALPIYYVGLLSQALIFGIFAMSLNLLLGYTGLPSLGHSAYFGTAAYATAVLSLRVSESFWLNAPGGVLLSVIIAGVYGLLALRTAGVYFLMITLALAQVLWGIALSWRGMTGGDNGLAGIPRPDLGLPLSLWDTHNFFYFVLVAFALMAAAMYVLVNSPFGYALRGIRENETRMRVLGYNVWLYKYLAFVIAGMFAGVAGVLFVYHNGFVSTSELSVVLSAKALLMVILGGAGTLFGPVLGAGVVVFLSHIVSAYTGRWLLVLGTVYVLVVLFAPLGILKGLQARLRVVV